MNAPPPDDPPPAPRAAPEPRRSTKGRGCLLLVLLTPVVVIAGVVIGTMLSNDDDDGADTVEVTVDEGELDGGSWRVDAVRDVQGETCVFLYRDGEQLTGACGSEVTQDATFSDSTVVFGHLAGATAEEVARVEVPVVAEPGSATSEVRPTFEIATSTVDDLDGVFFVGVVDAAVDVDGTATPIDE